MAKRTPIDLSSALSMASGAETPASAAPEKAPLPKGVVHRNLEGVDQVRVSLLLSTRERDDLYKKAVLAGYTRGITDYVVDALGLGKVEGPGA